jgi:hypothetical protein
VPSSAPIEISRPPASRSSDAIVRKWIVAIAELTGRELTGALVELWCRLLADIEPGLLERALEETAKRCKFFPTPGEVRTIAERFEDAAEREHVLEMAEQERQLNEQARKQLLETYNRTEAAYLSKRGLPQG